MLVRQNYFGRISGQIEVETHASPMPRPGVATSRSSGWEMYANPGKAGSLSSRVALTHGIRSSRYDFCGKVIHRKG